MPFIKTKSLNSYYHRRDDLPEHGDFSYISGRYSNPSYRVRSALKRISRDRHIPPEEFKKILFKLSKLASNGSSWGIVASASARDECCFVGMFRGEPIAYTFEDHYGYILDNVKKLKKKNDCSIYLLILESEIRRKKYHDQRTQQQKQPHIKS